MADVFLQFTGKINRRLPRSEGESSDPILRENFLARDGRLTKPRGTTRVTTDDFGDLEGVDRRATWATRYQTFETGIVNPKSFSYTQNGKIWHIDEQAKTMTKVADGLNLDAYPKSWLFKIQTQNILYLVDGKDLWKHDGNNAHKFEKIDITDTSGDSIDPIDVIEHKDRLILISEAFLYISKNLSPEVFNDATDSIQIIVGSGKGKNLALGKIEDKLYIFNTEGIFVLQGDVISAVAATFEVRLVDERICIAGRTVAKVEKALVFLADDLNIWSWDGVTSTKLSHDEKIEDDISNKRGFLDMAVATYFNNYYMISVVKRGEAQNKLEFWWDAFENKIDFIVGRNVSAYSISDPNVEDSFMMLCRSDINYMMWADREVDFDGVAIVTKLRTRDITIKKGRNVRFTAFYPEIIPTQGLAESELVIFKYLLDGQLVDPSSAAGTSVDPTWGQDLIGVRYELGAIKISNQAQAMYRVRPKINWARGQSIAFDMEEKILYGAITGEDRGIRFTLIGIGIDFILKEKVKGRLVGA